MSGVASRINGTVVHGEVRAGERRIWLHLTSEASKLATPATLGAAGGGIVVHVRDVGTSKPPNARARRYCANRPTSPTASGSTPCAIPMVTVGGSQRQRPRRL